MKLIGKTLGFVLAATLAFISFSCQTQDEVQSVDNSIIIEKFQNPDLDSKPMVRMWFTDAGYGLSEEGLAQVEKQINDIADGGFGGIEVAYLSDFAKYTNEETGEFGYGTKSWQNILKTILKTANAVETGFKVDITITSHWPPAVNNIDPNDDAASQETAYAYKKITKDDIAAGKVAVPLPVQKTEDASRDNPSESNVANFLFVDKFIAASLAKVVAFDSDEKPILEFASLKDLTPYTEKKTSTVGKEVDGIVYAGYAAGVPDKAYCESVGWDYNVTLEKFGPEPKDPNFSGKIDSDKNRKRMADWQYMYETDLSSVSGLSASDGNETLNIGDYVIFGSYYRGTGQTHSGSQTVTMYNRCFATDYFSDIAVQKIFDCWATDIMDDELLALLKENGAKNGTSIFEDSIEIQKDGAIWTYDLLDEFKNYIGYDAVEYAPVLAIGSSANFDDEEKATRIIEDYNLTLGNLYSVEHAAKIKDWAREFNYTYRAQAYPLPGLDVDAAAIAVDIPEGDNATAGDGVRQLASVVYMKGDKMMSMESTTSTANANSLWKDVAKELNADFSYGISRSILHGTPTSRAHNGYQSSWPGWGFFKGLGGSPGFSSWNGRQIYWADVNTFSNYVARMQSIMQNGTAKIDLAVLLDTETGYSNQGGNSLQSILDNGYSYSVLSEPVLQMDKAYVENGVLAPTGPAYKALIVKNAETFSASMVEKVLGYAQNGLPVILYNCDISRIYGTNKTDNNDESLQASLAGLMKLDNVSSVSSEAEILSALEQNGIEPSASYFQEGLEGMRRESEEGEYYYFYNGKGITIGDAMPPGMMGMGDEEPKGPITSGPALGGTGYNEKVTMMHGGGGMNPMGGSKEPVGRTYLDPKIPRTMSNNGNEVIEDDSQYRITTTVSLEGEGKPYLFDAWTGEITPIALYKAENGRITLDITLEKREAAVICIAKDESLFPSTGSVYATSTTGGEVVYENTALTHRAKAAGDYTVTLSDNSSKTVTVADVPQPMSLKSGWNLNLESWGPASEEAATMSLDNNYGYEIDPSVSAQTTTSFGNIDLCSWTDLPATKDQLVLLGVEGMNHVSGIGYYSLTFELPENWTAETGAYIKFAHNSDMIAEVRINGNLIDDVNQITDLMDAGKYLTSGTNTIEIKLDTTLENRASTKFETKYGLTDVTIIPYVETAL